MLGTLVVLLLGACAQNPPPPPSSSPPPAPFLSEPSGWPYWQAPSLELHPKPESGEVGGEASEPPWLASDEEWRPMATAIVAKLRTTGSVVHRTRNHETSVGSFYEERARRGAPIVITLDALFALSHLVFASVASDVESGGMQAEVFTLLHRLDARLSAEAPRARPDLFEGYRVARTAVAVALELAEPAYVVPAPLTEVASAEMALIRGHPGLVTSPLFGVPIDYGAFSPRGPIASATDPRAGMFEAAEWLGEAPFLFAAKSEAGGVAIDVGTARSQARAALLISRLLRKDGDADAAMAFSRITRKDRLTLGDADDLSPQHVGDLARRTGVDLRGGDDIVDTYKLDRFRHALAREGVALVSPDADAGSDASRGLRTMRILPLRAPPDGRVLQRLVTPFVGPLSATDAGTLRAQRRMPSALDVGAWLGSAVARDALVTRGDFGYGGFESALASLLELRPSGDSQRHASVYGSWLDSLSTWLRPSAVEQAEPRAIPTDDRRRLRTALVAWTFLRHDALPFAHEAPHARPSPTSPTPQRHAEKVWVDPHPEAIASLLGAVRQLHLGLAALDALREDSLSFAIAVEVEGILALALEASARQANGDAALAEIEPELAQIPSRIAALEGWAGSAADPVVIDVHLDATSGNVLEEGTGPLEEVFMRLRDPITRRPVLAVGATIPHWEFLASAASRLNDAAWRAELQEGRGPDREATQEPAQDPDRVSE
jgi:hypothetical protein